jgi:hypothetical protein
LIRTDPAAVMKKNEGGDKKYAPTVVKMLKASFVAGSI